MTMPTPGDVARSESVRGVIPSEGPCGDAPLDEALAMLTRSVASFETNDGNSTSVVEAAQALHERIQQRLEEAR